ncbi:MAG: hypothetical protein R3A80_05815 [Bdellovibrionota bacterium]
MKKIFAVGLLMAFITPKGLMAGEKLTHTETVAMIKTFAFLKMDVVFTSFAQRDNSSILCFDIGKATSEVQVTMGSVMNDVQEQISKLHLDPSDPIPADLQDQYSLAVAISNLTSTLEANCNPLDKEALKKTLLNIYRGYLELVFRQSSNKDEVSRAVFNKVRGLSSDIFSDEEKEYLLKPINNTGEIGSISPQDLSASIKSVEALPEGLVESGAPRTTHIKGHAI